MSLNEQLLPHKLANLLNLGNILQCEPGEIHATLTHSHVKPVEDEEAFIAPEDFEAVGAEEDGPTTDGEEADQVETTEVEELAGSQSGIPGRPARLRN